MGIVGPTDELSDRLPLEFLRLIADPLAAAIERCQLSECMKEEQEWWNSALDAVDTPVLIADESHRIHVANRAAREKLGIEVGAIRDVCCEGVPDRETCPLLEAASKGAGLVTELREAFGQEGGVFEASSFPIETSSNRESQVVQVFRDLTREHENREELVRSRQVSALGSLAAGVAHEIRNPLAAMMNSISLLKTSADEGTEEFELIQIVLEESRRVNRIVGDFLSFARPTAGTRSSTRVDVLIASTATLVRKDPRFSDGIELRVSVEPDLPHVAVDQDRIRQVLWNLLLNAGQAVAGNGSVVVGARAQQHQGKPAVLLFVEDSGPGIPEEIRRRVFEPFETTKPNGTGLGLSLARHIVESYAGSIFIESSDLGGAKLCIAMPSVSDEW
jgi:signal transduction histidine kinase